MQYHINDIKKAARFILQNGIDNKVFAFYGAMGTGKTTLITAICKELDVVDLPNSPTFSIINEYKTKEAETIYHIDLYRIKTVEEAIQSGVEEVLYSGCKCFIEWPQLAVEILPNSMNHIQINWLNDLDREIKMR